MTSILETDYTNWAVIVQCNLDKDNEAVFSSTRILSRSRHPDPKDLVAIENALAGSQADGLFRYPIDQSNCEELDSMAAAK